MAFFWAWAHGPAGAMGTAGAAIASLKMAAEAIAAEAALRPLVAIMAEDRPCALADRECVPVAEDRSAVAVDRFAVAVDRLAAVALDRVAVVVVALDRAAVVVADRLAAVDVAAANRMAVVAVIASR